MNTDFRPDVISIIIPCYNCQNFLSVCLDALLRQTCNPKKMELILVNDGSSDSTWKIINDYEDIFRQKGADFIKINQKNAGVGAAVNAALKYVSGEFFVWQDPDDFYEPDALEKLHSYLKSHEHIGFVRGEVNFRAENEPEKVMRVGRSSQTQSRDIGKDLMLRRDMYCMAGCFMGRSAVFFEYNQGRGISASRAGQNFQLLLPFVAAGDCGYLQEVVLNCLVRSASLSHARKSIPQSIRQKQEYLRILRYTFQKIKMPENRKKELFALANGKYTPKIRRLKFKLLMQWMFFKHKELRLAELIRLIFDDID